MTISFEDQVSPPMTNDEACAWLDIYAEARVAELTDIPFTDFQQAPWTHLANAGQDCAVDCLNNGCRPLLPAQARASRKIQEEWAGQDRKSAAATRSHLKLVHSR